MNRIDAAFERARARDRAALMPFVTGGDPDLRPRPSWFPELERAGADIIETRLRPQRSDRGGSDDPGGVAAGAAGTAPR